jgi:RNA polymerase sigma factor (sigma-70 family)
MPIHERFKRDAKTKKVILDGNGNSIIEVEGIDYGKFPTRFIADTEEEAERLYKKYNKTLQLLANRYSVLTGLSTEDLIQEGTIGLARASRDFESERSRDFNVFAVYRIKDAMREFVTSQSINTGVVSTVKPVNISSLLDIWETSGIYENDKEIGNSISKVRQSLSNLAKRSCTTVEQLIERADLMPIADMEITDYNVADLPNQNEDDMLSSLTIRKYIDRIKSILSESDYDLLVSHFVEGKTVRELEEKLDLKASTVTIKIHNIVSKLLEKRDSILNHANNNNIKKAK